MADRVKVTDDGVERSLGLLGRKRESVTWAALREVRILTTSDGPLAEDVFFVLIDSDGGCLVPQEAAPPELIERLQALPGFDNEAMVEAMSSTEDAEFVCWSQSD